MCRHIVLLEVFLLALLNSVLTNNIWCMKETKIIALYLPQFHCIPENDEFWGKGFTDWKTVKNAKPIYSGHIQPREPLDGNYYDLSEKHNVLWQANLAKEAGIYGFGVYHYWFNNEKNLLTKPAEIMRDTEDLGVKYFFVWDNCNWKRSWSNVPGNEWAPVAETTAMKKEGPTILIPYILGHKEDWQNHYRYVRQHFYSENYEKIYNKPVFSIIFNSRDILEMCKYWDDLAKEDGFDGIFWIFKHNKNMTYPSWASVYDYQPHYESIWKVNWPIRIKRKIKSLFGLTNTPRLRYFDYDNVWKDIISHSKQNGSPRIFNGAFVDYDDSPRRGATRACIFKGATPEKFENYFRELYNLSCFQEKEYLFLTAWNEWGEGAYLEPDKQWGNRYLDALASVTKSKSV